MAALSPITTKVVVIHKPHDCIVRVFKTIRSEVAGDEPAGSDTITGGVINPIRATGSSEHGDIASNQHERDRNTSETQDDMDLMSQRQSEASRSTIRTIREATDFYVQRRCVANAASTYEHSFLRRKLLLPGFQDTGNYVVTIENEDITPDAMNVMLCASTGLFRDIGFERATNYREAMFFRLLDDLDLAEAALRSLRFPATSFGSLFDAADYIGLDQDILLEWLEAWASSQTDLDYEDWQNLLGAYYHFDHDGKSFSECVSPSFRDLSTFGDVRRIEQTVTGRWTAPSCVFAILEEARRAGDTFFQKKISGGLNKWQYGNGQRAGWDPRLKLVWDHLDTDARGSRIDHCWKEIGYLAGRFRTQCIQQGLSSV